MGINEWGDSKAPLNSPITVGHSNVLEPKLILIMRILWSHYFPTHIEFLVEI